MWKLILSKVSVKGWVINMNVQGFYYIPSDCLQIPVHYGEAFGVDQMLCDVTGGV